MSPGYTPALHREVLPGPLRVRAMHVLPGANFFSWDPVVQVRLDLGAYAEIFSNLIPGFVDRLRALLPSLYEHKCSEGRPGGFFYRMELGTLLGHVAEHVALELQIMAGFDVAFGKTRESMEPGVYNVVFRFEDEAAGLHAGRVAVNLLNALLQGQGFDVAAAVQDLRELRWHSLGDPTTRALHAEARRRQIPVLPLGEPGLVQLGTGARARRFIGPVPENVPFIAVQGARDAERAARMLQAAGFRTTPLRRVSRAEDAVDAWGNFGRAEVALLPHPESSEATTWLSAGSERQALEAATWLLARRRSVEVLPVPRDRAYRFLVLEGRFYAAREVRSVALRADGRNTVRQLLAERAPACLEFCPAGEDLHEEVPAEGLRVEWRRDRVGVDVTARVAPDVRRLAERAAQVLGLAQAEVELTLRSLDRLADAEATVLRVTPFPDLPAFAHVEELRNPVRDVVARHFPDAASARIPLVAVTGSAGKTIAAHLIADALGRRHATGLASSLGRSTGAVRHGDADLLSPATAHGLLTDSALQAAVLEVPHRLLLKSGLPYSMAEVGLVLNALEDHIGFHDVRDLEDLTYLFAVVGEQVYDEGTTVLNADEEHLLEMIPRLYSRTALFTRQPANTAVRSHLRKGGLVTMLDEGQLILYRAGYRLPLARVEEVPLLAAGRAPALLDAVLGACAALAGLDVAEDEIRGTLLRSHPLPHRLQCIARPTGTALWSDASTTLAGVQQALAALPAERERGVALELPPDRSPELLARLGSVLAGSTRRLLLQGPGAEAVQHATEAAGMVSVTVLGNREELRALLAREEGELRQWLVLGAEPGALLTEQGPLGAATTP